jgi:hypothetical protein
MAWLVSHIDIVWRRGDLVLRIDIVWRCVDLGFQRPLLLMDMVKIWVGFLKDIRHEVDAWEGTVVASLDEL